MRYNPLLHRKGRFARRGIAVMFALGILSLIIIAVLIFSRRAVVDRKVASAYANYNGAKDIAMSAFGRAVLQLKKNAATNTTFYSSGSEDFDWLWKMDAARRYFPKDGTCPIRWQYVYDSDGHIIGRYAYLVIGSDRLKLNGMLDHRFCLRDAVCTGGTECPYQKRLGNSNTELQIDSSKFTSYIDEPIDSPHLQGYKDGDKVAQYESPEHFVYLRGLTRKAGGSVSYGRVMQVVNTWFNVSLSKALEEPEAWFGGDLNGNKVKDKDELFQRFPIRQKDWNTITVDDILKDAVPFYDAEGKAKTDNTAGLPWLKNWTDTYGNWPDAATKAKQIAANLINYNAPASRPVVSDKDPNTWSFEVVPTYTGNKRTWYLNECRVLLRVRAIQPDPVEHEVKNGEGVTIATWYSFGDTAEKPCEFEVRLYVWPEIINMFKAAVAGDTNPYAVLSADEYSVKVAGKLELTYCHWDYNEADWADDGKGSNTSVYDGTYKYTAEYPKEGVSCYLHKTGSSYRLLKFVADATHEEDQLYVDKQSIGKFASTSSEPTLKTYFKVKDVSLNLKLILTKKNGEVVESVDFASLPAMAKEGSTTFNTSSASLITKYFSADDPRHNLHAEDWSEQEETQAKANKGNTCKGASFSPSTGWDKDPEVKMAGQTNSTAFIRHAPMESLWELGAIHRAAPWQTINFKRPKESSATEAERLAENLTAKGGGAYGEGDFRLLDQVTMQGGTSYTPMAQFGRINLCAPSTAVRTFNFHALLRNMKWSSAKYGRYDGSDSPKTLLTLSDGEREGTTYTLAKTIKSLNSAPDSLRLFRRSDIYLTKETAENNFWDLTEKNPYDGTSLIDNSENDGVFADSLQEQLICRFIGLTDVYSMPDSATVIVLAQTIQDVGGGIKVYRDWAGDGMGNGTTVPTASKARLAAGYYYQATNSDSISNPGFFKTSDFKFYDTITAKFGQYDNGADKITGEALLQARLQYDRDQGKWKIVQVKYED